MPNPAIFFLVICYCDHFCCRHSKQSTFKSRLSRFQKRPLWYITVVSIPCNVINEFQQRVQLRCAKTKTNIVWQDDVVTSHHVSSQEPGCIDFCCIFFSCSLPERFFYTRVFFYGGLLNCSPLSEEESAGSHRSSLSQLIVDVFVCVSVCLYSKGGGDLRGCQMPQDAAEHVGTGEAETPTRLTDTTLTSRGNKHQNCLQNILHT